ncbi:6 carbohydrate binding protein [Pelomyxa schiedti]|nr:6 carbohydrate binding protein [Pelomyxa schiedti]
MWRLRCIVVALVFASVLRGALATSRLSIEVDPVTVDYTIRVDGEDWFHGGPIGVRNNRKWHSTQDDNFPLTGVSSGQSSDTFGIYDFTNAIYRANDLEMQATFKSYLDTEMIVFEQYFPNGANDTSAGTTVELVSCFPSFIDVETDFMFLTYEHTFAEPNIGWWDKPIFEGGEQGGVPMIIYDDQLRTLVFSPLSNFMAGTQTISAHFGDIFACGIQGKVETLPVGFRHTTILSFGTSVTNAVASWGGYLLKSSGKVPTYETDLSTSTLGYYTDNGAYYYYLTEYDENYEDTMINIALYQSSVLPDNYYQLDSWWYYKGVNNGVKLWEPRSDIFPNGMQYLDSEMGNPPYVLHNRYFSPDNDYIGMNFSFIVEDYTALPLDRDTFDYIMGKAVTWGMTVYEQDWLVTTYTKMEATRTSVDLARQWLLNMGSAASDLGVFIQYCMPLPNFLLESTEIPAVSQARASDDYQPGNKQWQILHSSMLIWALGMVPFKDNFWSSSPQEGCPYTVCKEPNTKLQTLVSALSAGPVAIGDMIDGSDQNLVMRTCMNDGTLLKPDFPAIPIDKSFWQFNLSIPTVIHLGQTTSTVSGISWHFVFCAELPYSMELYPQDIGIDAKSTSVAIDYFDNPNAVSAFSSSSPLKLSEQGYVPDHTEVPFKYYIIAPDLSSGWSFIGDMNKFITVSPTRIKEVSDNGEVLTVDVYGSPTESVSLWFSPPTTGTRSLLIGSCTVPKSQNFCTVTCFCEVTCMCSTE